MADAVLTDDGWQYDGSCTVCGFTMDWTGEEPETAEEARCYECELSRLRTELVDARAHAARETERADARERERDDVSPLGGFGIHADRAAELTPCHRCNEGGSYWPACPWCGDSTNDHDCPPRVACDHEPVMARRALIAAELRATAERASAEGEARGLERAEALVARYTYAWGVSAGWAPLASDLRAMKAVPRG